MRLEIAEKAACVPLIVETGCQEIVELITGRKYGKTKICWTIVDIKEILKKLNQAIIQHTPRLCNGTANSLAKLTLNILELVMWVENYPTHLMYYFNSLNQRKLSFTLLKKKKKLHYLLTKREFRFSPNA